MTWITTISGRCVDFVNPDPGQICIDDIATALSRIPRFAGHTVGGAYCVASHSCHVARNCPDFKLEALLHDAHEAYTMDITSPLKWLLGEAIHEVEKRLQTAIHKAFGLPEGIPDIVKEVDLRMLWTEKRDLLPPHGREWDWPNPPEPYKFRVLPESGETAKRRFLKMFNDLATPGV